MPEESDDANYWATLVPELVVSDLSTSLMFWCEILGFRQRFGRPEDGFVYLTLGRAQVMLEQVADGVWRTASLRQPFGRGMNLQIEVEDVDALHARVRAGGIVPFRPMRTTWYREGDRENGQREFLVQDPDGYLLRFAQHMGHRPISPPLD